MSFISLTTLSIHDVDNLLNWYGYPTVLAHLDTGQVFLPFKLENPMSVWPNVTLENHLKLSPYPIETYSLWWLNTKSGYNHHITGFTARSLFNYCVCYILWSDFLEMSDSSQDRTAILEAMVIVSQRTYTKEDLQELRSVPDDRTERNDVYIHNNISDKLNALRDEYAASAVRRSSVVLL